METLNHLTLERELVAELDACVLPKKKEPPITVRRETVLSILSRSAQTLKDFCEILNEAGLLAASALEMEFFGHAQIQRTDSLTMHWASAIDCNRNIDPVPAEVIWDTSSSAFAYAIEVAHPILIGNVVEEKRFSDPKLIAEKICGGAICPIIYREQLFGAIGVFTAAPRVLTKDDVLFLQSIALLLGPTRAHQKTERALAEQSRFLSTAIDSLDAMVVLLDANGTVLQINRACRSSGGFTPEQLRGRKLWSAFFLPNEEANIQALIHDVATGKGQRRCDAFFVTKSGDRRRVNWTITRMPNLTGDAIYLATGIDITEQFAALTKLEEMEAKLARSARKQDSDSLVAERDSQREVEVGSERRRHDRRPYACVQSIAPCLEGKLPDRRDFREVRCHDISPRGFSFLLDTRPDFDALVVAFGSAQSQLFLRAKVKHISSFAPDGKSQFKIGCEYLGRVRLPWIAEAKTS